MRLLIVISLLLAAPRVADAQFPAEVRPGTRVRVWVPEPARQAEGPYRRQLLRGTVESVDGSLRLRVPGATSALTIPRASVRRLDVSRGVSRPASAVERAVGGAIGGAILFGLLNDPQRSGGPHYRTDWRAAGVGAAWGAGIGAVVGFTFPHERWRRVIR
ncbi:MAG TPA: hypothetical protein VK494_01950 [Gemmatimonadaceae bacterium]|nr:hypothetical protein [Gemmatimonadaceae bacterium]